MSRTRTAEEIIEDARRSGLLTIVGEGLVHAVMVAATRAAYLHAAEVVDRMAQLALEQGLVVEGGSVARVADELRALAAKGDAT
jgi:hypothetical protein